MVQGRAAWVAIGAVAMLAAMSSSSCEDDRPPTMITGRPPPPDGDADADVDGDGDLDAAADAPHVDVRGDICNDAIDIRASYDPGDDGAYHIAGNLDDFQDDLESTCGLNYDTDAAYVYVPPANGQLRTDLGGAYTDLMVRTTCDDPETELSCVSYPSVVCGGGSCGHVDPVEAGRPVYLIVDGRFTQARDYMLEVQYYPWAREGAQCSLSDPARTCMPPLLCRVEGKESRCRAMICGDGVVDGDLFQVGPSEECDDGNPVGGDGCSESCSFETQGPAGDACGDAPAFHLAPANDSLFPGPYGTGASDTTAALPDLEGTCAPTLTSPDQVWRLDVDVATPLTLSAVSTTDGYDPVLYVIRDDGGGACSGEELGCAVAAADVAAALTFDAMDPGTYWIVVDGQDGEAVPSGGYGLEAAGFAL